MEQLADSEYNIAVEKSTITQYFFSEANPGTTRRYRLKSPSPLHPYQFPFNMCRKIWEEKMEDKPENLIVDSSEYLDRLTKEPLAAVAIQDEIERFPQYPCKVRY